MINAEKLYKEIELFKKWADENYPDWSEENDNGDWVMEEHSHFREMCDAVMEIIKTRDPYEDDEIMANAVLFVVARFPSSNPVSAANADPVQTQSVYSDF